MSFHAAGALPCVAVAVAVVVAVAVAVAIAVAAVAVPVAVAVAESAVVVAAVAAPVVVAVVVPDARRIAHLHVGRLLLSSVRRSSRAEEEGEIFTA